MALLANFRALGRSLLGVLKPVLAVAALKAVTHDLSGGPAGVR